MKIRLLAFIIIVFALFCGCSDLMGDREITLKITNADPNYWLIIATGTKDSPVIQDHLLPLEQKDIVIKNGKCVLFQTCWYNEGVLPAACSAFYGPKCYTKDTTMTVDFPDALPPEPID